MVVNYTKDKKINISDELLKELNYIEDIDAIYKNKLLKNKLLITLKLGLHMIAFDVKDYVNKKGFSLFTGKDLQTNLYQCCVKDKYGTIITESYYDCEIEAIFDMAERIRSGLVV